MGLFLGLKNINDDDGPCEKKGLDEISTARLVLIVVFTLFLFIAFCLHLPKLRTFFSRQFVFTMLFCLFNLTGDVYEYIITALHPGKKYDVRVTPGSLNVPGQWFTVEMPLVMNANAAPTMHLLSSDPFSVVVMWETTTGKTNESYKLMYREGGVTDNGPFIIPEISRGFYLVNNLTAGTLYEFHLWSSMEGKDGPARVVAIRTLSDVDLEPDAGATYSEDVVQVDVEVTSFDSLKLSWQLPASVENAMFYTVRYSTIADANPLMPRLNMDSEVSVAGHVHCTANHVQLTNLTPYTSYELSIRYHDSQGRFSMFSSPIRTRTMARIASPPRHVTRVELDGQDANTVQLTWQPPLHPNGIITGFIIYVSSDPKVDMGLWTKYEEHGSKLRTEIRGLLPNMVYYVRMQGRNSAGLGQLTDSLEISTQTQAASTTQGSNHSTHYERQNLNYQTIVVICVSIGLGVVFICAVFLMQRSRCIKSLSPDHGDTAANILASTRSVNTRAMAHANGNGANRQNGVLKNKFAHIKSNGNNHREVCASSVEMEAFVPMLSTIPAEVSAHLDTKVSEMTISTKNKYKRLSCW